MKKENIKMLFVFIIGLLLVPTFVNAESVTVGRVNYAYSDHYLTCSNVEGNFSLRASGTDDTFVYVKKSGDNDTYKYFFADSSCSLATNREVFDYIQNQITNGWKNYYLFGNDIYYLNYYSEEHMEYALATEETLVEDAIYFETDPITGNYIYVTNPIQTNIGSYYRNYLYIRPSEYAIDSSAVYYQRVGDSYQIVNNPQLENILGYRLKVPFEELAISTNQHISNNMATIGAEYASSHDGLTYLGVSDITRVNNVFYISLTFQTASNDYIHLITDLDGNIIEELSGYYFLSSTDDEKYFLYTLIEDGKGYFGLLDNNYNKIFKIEKTDIGSYNYYNNNDHYYFEYVNADGQYKMLYFIPYKVLDGNNQDFNNNDLSFRFNGSLSIFSKVLVNDVELPTTCYAKANGSTIIKLNKSYLNTLKAGKYTLKVEWTDGGYANALFTIPEPNPKTGDGIMTYIIICFISIISIISFGLFLNKKESIK